MMNHSMVYICDSIDGVFVTGMLRVPWRMFNFFFSNCKSFVPPSLGNTNMCVPGYN